MTKNAAERIHDVARIKISGCDLVQHRRKENEILATDQRHLYVRSTREPFVEVHCRVKPGKSATGNDYSSRLHAITANRNATRAIKILLMAAIIQSFSIFFSSFSASKLSEESWFFRRIFIRRLSSSEQTAALLSEPEIDQQNHKKRGQN